jgi:thiaminase/transcriptional activator TenA
VTTRVKGPFTAELLNEVQAVLQDILACEFVGGLADGTLSYPSFAHYLSQDELYLRQDNEALELVAQRAPNGAYRDFFRTLAQDGLAVEKALHDDYLTHFGVKAATQQSPVFKAYGEFLLEHARHSAFPVAIAALLPCFWIYAYTGEFIDKHRTENNIYKKFIDTYSGQEYENYVEKFIGITEELGNNASPEIRTMMKETFFNSASFELKVFEEATELGKVQ